MSTSVNPENPAGSGSDHSSLESVMADYVERIESGEDPNPAEYLANHPQHVDELRSFFRNHHWLAEGPAPVTPSLVGQRVGDYEIECEIARGGMGVVYRARQEGLDRPVALKLISSGVLAGEEERRRFRIEAEAAARLDHPGIIAIHETGSWQGYEYFSMTLVEGATLQERVNQNSFDDQESARIVREIAAAVAYAHNEGIVHRDLKPENILICKDGRPCVTDFGLAKWHREGSVLSQIGITRTGQVLGTPHYMSREQASGRSNGDSSTDIYSLGAILYALLTGQPPHAGASAAEVLRSVLQDEPPNPRQIRREIPLDLENVCLKAMRSNANERYESAQALADDLDRFLKGEATRAAGSGLLDVMAREIRRDQHQDYFKHWGMTLYTLGAIIFVAHIAIFILDQNFPHWVSYWGPRSLMLATIAGLIYQSRRGQILPRTVAERPVWSIWFGYLASLAMLNVIIVICEIDPNVLFPIASALSAFGFIAMGGHIWGGSALFGFGFLVVSLITAIFPQVGALIFGLMWLVSMVGLGRHYRGRSAAD